MRTCRKLGHRLKTHQDLLNPLAGLGQLLTFYSGLARVLGMTHAKSATMLFALLHSSQRAIPATFASIAGAFTRIAPVVEESPSRH